MGHCLGAESADKEFEFDVGISVVNRVIMEHI